MFLIQPKRHLLTKRLTKGREANVGENRKLKIIKDEVIYISIVDIVKNLLVNEEYKKLLEHDVLNNGKNIRFFMDGSYAKDNSLLQIHGLNCLTFLLYFDEVNLVDTASHRPTKMGMFYLIIGNVHPRYKSKLFCINFLTAVESNILSNYDMDDILTPLIEDFKTLENGVEISDGLIVHGTLIAVIGDNLASHKLGGFKEGFTARHCCRYCTADLSLVRTSTREDSLLLRTIAEYDDQIKKLDSAKNVSKRKDLSTDFGINRGSILNTLKDFHVLTKLPPDLFHDIIEGCLLRHLQLLLIKYLLGKKKIMTLDEFNEKLMEFDYGYTETKPSIILLQHLKEGSKLQQTGMQIWYLGILLPFILGPKVDEKDEYWENYMLLLEIMSLAFACEMSLSEIGYLQEKVDEYLTDFQILFNVHLTPKQHFLVHYPSLILKFGPLYNYITLRPEAKHQFFKNFMRQIRCLKNPALSMANQHQIYQTYIFGGPLVTIDE